MPNYRSKNTSFIPTLILIIVLLIAGILIWKFVIPQDITNKAIDVITGDEQNNSSVTTKPPEDLVKIVDNPNSKDVLINVLKSFINKDETDRLIYIESSKDSRYFAYTLHNNAEKEGIKGRIVELHFSNSDNPYYINGFETIDRGTIYIDCAGRRIGDKEILNLNFDKVAYIKIGHQYGVIDFDKVMYYADPKALTYEFYESYNRSNPSSYVYIPSGILLDIKEY